MPVFNGEKYLDGALKALLHQTFTDFELVISDNASTDLTERICREAAERDSRIRYIRQEVNIGAVSNFNYVLQQARGSYFLWAAVDDLWSPNYLETLHRFLDSAPEYVTAQAECQVIDSCGSPVEPIEVNRAIEDTRLWSRVWLMARQRASPMSFYGLHRRQVLEQIGMVKYGLAPGFANCCEIPVLLYLGCVGPTRYLSEASFYYRLHEDQFSNRRNPFHVNLRIRLNVIYLALFSLWRGTRSPLITLAGFCAVAFFQLRCLIWEGVQRTLRIPIRTRSVAKVN
jgi:glycosyltransferase involved in cell wall biosynthesis